MVVSRACATHQRAPIASMDDDKVRIFSRSRIAEKKIFEKIRYIAQERVAKLRNRSTTTAAMGSLRYAIEPLRDEEGMIFDCGVR
jgi:hypothetical protein